ncbi:hypothetical protein ACL02O_32940 [Micromonospora sp. MS34]|uniref:hypothetical protein n=1 Tax=Micromonospora sp. MS34 TaxID=3385971 RepID=UPI0039A0EA49
MTGGSPRLSDRTAAGGNRPAVGLALVAALADGGGQLVPIHRSLVVDGVLWTVSEPRLETTDFSTMRTLGWLPTA